MSTSADAINNSVAAKSVDPHMFCAVGQARWTVSHNDISD